MRNKFIPQISLGCVPIPHIEIDLNSRDDIPKILLGLQYLDQDTKKRDAALAQIEKDLGEKVNLNNGAPGMTFWQILVLGTLRLGLNCDFDRLQELANQHQTIRAMLGHGSFDSHETYGARTIAGNLAKLKPETLEMINWVVVSAAHDALGIDENTPLHARADSSVIKTDVEYPTDIGLLNTAIRKILDLGGKAAMAYDDIRGWREYEAHIHKFDKLYKRTIKLRKSNAKDEARRAKRAMEIEERYHELLDKAEFHVTRAKQLLETLGVREYFAKKEIEVFIEHAERQIDQIRRRVLQGEHIPHDEKVFSLFEPHTEWIVKGKAGVPVELGLRTAFLEGTHGLILTHHVMEKQTDDKIATYLVEKGKILHPNLASTSFDKGFYSLLNLPDLQGMLDHVTLPKKGRLSQEDKQRESSEEFVEGRKRHPGIESAIHSLQVHGLDRCPDRGIEGFRRYVAWGIVAFNLHKLGAILMEQEREKNRQNLEAA